MVLDVAVYVALRGRNHSLPSVDDHRGCEVGSGDSRGARHWRLAALLSLACGAACGGIAHEPSDPLVTDQRTRPPLVLELRADRDEPLELSYLVWNSDSSLLSMEKRSGDLWMLPLAGGRPRRVGSVNVAGRRRVLGMRASMGLVSMIDVSGRITEDSFAAPNPTIVAHRPPGMRRKLLGFARLLDGSFLVMESAVSLTPGQWIPTDTVSVTRVFRPDSQVLLAQWERAGRRDPLGSVSDFLSLSASTEGVFVAGSAPPRGAIISTRGRQFPTFTAFEGIVPPPYDAADARELATELHRRGVPDAEIARLSHVYPAVAGAIRVADTWFVSSPTSRERFRLMSGCDHRPFRDVIAGPDIAAIHLLEDGLVLVRDHIEDGMLRVEFSSYSDFPTPCKP